MGVTSFGLFVELIQYYVEGLVHVTSLPNDYYQFDPIKHSLIGQKKLRTFRLGDEILVRLISVNMEARTIDLEMIEIKKTPFKNKGK